MGMLRNVFGPSKDEIWSQLARDLGGSYHDGGFLGRDVLRYRSGQWELTLDTYTQSSNQSSTTYTRMRTPFVNKDGLRFSIYREGVFSGLGRMLGMQDIKIGDPFFDREFVIKGNNEERIRLLLRDERLRNLIRAQPRIHLRVREDEGWFGESFPDGVDELYFQCVGVVKDAVVLKGLFDLFTCILERLVQIDSAYEDDPGVRL